MLFHFCLLLFLFPFLSLFPRLVPCITPVPPVVVAWSLLYHTAAPTLPSNTVAAAPCFFFSLLFILVSLRLHFFFSLDCSLGREVRSLRCPLFFMLFCFCVCFAFCVFSRCRRRTARTRSGSTASAPTRPSATRARFPAPKKEHQLLKKFSLL